MVGLDGRPVLRLSHRNSATPLQQLRKPGFVRGVGECWNDEAKHCAAERAPGNVQWPPGGLPKHRFIRCASSPGSVERWRLPKVTIPREYARNRMCAGFNPAAVEDGARPGSRAKERERTCPIVLHLLRSGAAFRDMNVNVT